MDGSLHIATTHMAGDLQQSVVFLSTQVSHFLLSWWPLQTLHSVWAWITFMMLPTPHFS